MCAACGGGAFGDVFWLDRKVQGVWQFDRPQR
jgi:hypothetical protein